MKELSQEELRASIVPKSDQLNADSLLTGPITVTVTSVARGDKEQPIAIGIDGGHQPFKPCKSMRRVLIAAWGDDGRDWVGRKMTLFCDPEVMWAGVKVGGIRISHLSDIKEDMTLLLTSARGKRSQFVIRKITDQPAKTETPLTDAEAKYVEDCKKEIARFETVEDLETIIAGLTKKSDAVKNMIRPIYAARKAELSS